MTIRPFLLSAVMLPLVSGAALAQSCTSPTTGNFGVTLDPSGTAASIIFDDFFLAGGDADPGSFTMDCAVAVPFANDGYRVFSADLRSFGTLEDADQSYELAENGGTWVVVGGPLAGDDAQFDVARYGVGPGEELDLDFLLTLNAGTGPDAEGGIDTIDLTQIAYITEDELQNSLDGMARDAAGAIVHLGASADLLLGGLEALEGEDKIAAVAAAGSYLLGVNGRLNFGGGLSLVGGAAFFQQDAGTSAGGLLLATGLRYVSGTGEPVRFFGEAGIWGSPNLSMAFLRSYEDQGGPFTSGQTVTAASTATGMLATAYGKAGVLLDLDEVNQLALYGSLSGGVFGFGAFSETAGDDNIFALASSGGTQGFATARLGASWTARAAEDFEVTAAAAIGAAFGGDLDVDIAYAGAQTGSPGPLLFIEGGIRAAYHVTDQVQLSGFVTGTAGPQIGAHAQLGGGVSVKF